MNSTTLDCIIFGSIVILSVILFIICTTRRYKKNMKRILHENLWDGFISMAGGFKYVPHDYVTTSDSYIYYDEFGNARYEAVVWKTGSNKGMVSIFEPNNTNNIILSSFNTDKSKEMARLLMVNR